MTVSTVDTSGSGDYTTWQAWEDACPADITAGGTNENWEGEGVNEEFVGSDAQVTFGGITTDATHRLLMRPASGDGWVDNVDPDTDALRYNSSLGCSLHENRNFQNLLDFGGSTTVRCEVLGLQLKASAIAARGIISTSHTQPVLLDQCICDFLSSYGSTQVINLFYGSGDVSRIRNSAIIHTGTTSPSLQGRDVVCEYVTFYGSASQSQVLAGYGEHTFTNCLFLNSNDFQASTEVHIVDSCVTDLSSWESSTATTSVLNATGSDEIENDSGSNTTVDLRIKSGGDCDGGGENISGITTDIYGNTRDGSTPTVGCMEVLSAGGNTITADQDEAGDSQSASISALVQISANQSESGDTQAAAISPIIQISVSQAEAGDTQAASISVVAEANISASQSEDGDTQVAALSSILVTSITANQSEAGEQQSASITSIIQVSANQAESGDTQVASMTNVVQLFSNQSEAGDTQTAAIVGVSAQSLTANQTESGDTTVAQYQNVVSININQNETGDTQNAILSRSIEITASQTEQGDGQTAPLAGPSQINGTPIPMKDGQNAPEYVNTGLPMDNGVLAIDTASAIDRVENGLAFTTNGRVCVALEGSVDRIVGGLPRDPSGRLVISEDNSAYTQNRTPFTIMSRIAAVLL